MRFTHVSLAMLLVVTVHDTPSALAAGTFAKTPSTKKNVGPLQRKQALRGLPRNRRVQSVSSSSEESISEESASEESVSEESISEESVSEESVSEESVSEESISEEESVSEESVSSISDDSDEESADADRASLQDELLGDIGTLEDELEDLEEDIEDGTTLLPPTFDNVAADRSIGVASATASTISATQDGVTVAPGTEATAASTDAAAPEAGTAAPEASSTAAIPDGSTSTPITAEGAAEFLQENGQMEVLTELLQTLRGSLAEVTTTNPELTALLEARDSFICPKKGKAGKKKKAKRQQKGNRALQDDPLEDLEADGDETIAELEASDDDSDSSDSSSESFNGLSLSDESIEDAQKAIQRAEKDATATMLMIQEYKLDVANPDTDLKKLAKSSAKAGKAVMKTMKKIEEAVTKVEYALGLPPAEDGAAGGVDNVRRVLQKDKKGPKRKRGKAMGKAAKEARKAEKAAKKEAKAKARAEKLKELEEIKEKVEKEDVVVDDLIDLVEQEDDDDDDDDDCELPDFDVTGLAETLFRDDGSILSEIDAILEEALEASDNEVDDGNEDGTDDQRKRRLGMSIRKK